MRLRSRIKTIEEKLSPIDPIMIVAQSEKEADEQILKILEDDPNARIRFVLIAPPVNRLPNAGM